MIHPSKEFWYKCSSLFPNCNSIISTGPSIFNCNSDFSDNLLVESLLSVLLSCFLKELVLVKVGISGLLWLSVLCVDITCCASAVGDWFLLPLSTGGVAVLTAALSLLSSLSMLVVFAFSGSKDGPFERESRSADVIGTKNFFSYINLVSNQFIFELFLRAYLYMASTFHCALKSDLFLLVHL